MSSRRNSERSRARILMAAEKVFSQKGYDGARIDEIAREAGCNKALLYYYFKSKKAVLDALLNDFFIEATEKLAAYVAAGGLLEKAPLEQSETNQTMFDFYFEKRNLIRVIIMESLKDNEVTPHVFRFVDLPQEQVEMLTQALLAQGIEPDSDIEYAQFLEFFTGVVPTIMFAVLAEAWGRRFGIDKEKMKALFMRAYDETHMAHHRNQ